MLNYLEKKIHSMHEQMGHFNREPETIMLQMKKK